MLTAVDSLALSADVPAGAEGWRAATAAAHANDGALYILQPPSSSVTAM